jgi:hypothetical protein
MVDRTLNSDVHIELYCLRCGKRWPLRYPEKFGGFGRWIMKTETLYLTGKDMGF